MALPPSKHLADLLATHVITSGWQIEIGAWPDKPDRAMVIFDTQGLGESPNPKYLLDFPTCQIVVRGATNDYLAAYQEARDVRDILLGIDSQDINGDRMVSITINGDLGFIGRDENFRPMFSMNFALIIEPQVSANSNRVAL